MANLYPLGEGQTFTNQNVPSPPGPGWRAGHQEPPDSFVPVQHYEDVRYTLAKVGELCGDTSVRHLISTILRGVCQSDIETIRALYAKGME